MYFSFRFGALALIAAALPVAAWSQASRNVTGHWQGSLKNQGQDLGVVADISRTQKGEWIGTFGMPDVGLVDLPLSAVVVGPTGVRFTVAGFPGTPSFDGKLSADGRALTGTFTADKKPMPLALKRTGEAKVSLPTANTKISKALEGAWQGTMDGGQTATFHIVLKLGHAADGSATGTMVSVDRGNLESALTSISNVGNFLQFEIRSLNGTYRGALNAAGTEIKGEWTQSGHVTPLIFQRGASTTSANSALSDSMAGTWRGLIDMGGEAKIQLLLKLSRAADGTALGTMTNSEAKSKELPLSAIVVKGSSLQFEVGLLKAKFTGTVSGSTISGTWTQQGLLENFPLTFRR